MSEPRQWDLLWRGVVFVASVFGILSLTIFLGFIAGQSEGDIVLLAVVPVVAGLISALAPMENRTRILLLWIASVLLALFAVLTIIYGIGLILFMVAAAYVMAAWMLNEAQMEDPAVRPTTPTTQTDRDNSRFPVWRLVTAIVSSVGLAGVAVVWRTLDEAGPEHLLLTSAPLLVGVVAVVARMETQTRVLLLWVAAALSGLVAALTIFSGAGFILLPVMLGYLLSAWKMNEHEPVTAQ